MKRLILRSGIVGDHDGAYDWVRPDMMDDPDYSVGYHPSAWSEDSYTIVEVVL